MTRQISSTILAGDTYSVVFTTSYSSADGYSASLKLTGPSGSPSKFNFAANANTNSATSYDIRISPSVSANLAPGLYAYAVVVASNTDSYTVETGNVTVAARADLSVNSDLRTHNVRVYDAICALIEGRATSDVASYTIAGRSLNKIPLRELLELKSHYSDLIRQEQGKSQKKLVTRFSSAS
jgi:hypothetical protein